MNSDYLYTAAQVRQLDSVAIGKFGISGLTLMRRAALACVKQAKKLHPVQVTVFCGSGNNAGDGYIIAGMLAEQSMLVQVVVVGDPGKLSEDAKEAYRYCQQSPAVIQQLSNEPEFDLNRNGLIIDALLGTGLSGAVRKDYQSVIETINNSDAAVLAVDIPSGLCADTGAVLGVAVKADMTVTFIAHKRGLFTNDGPDYCGSIVLDALDVPADVFNDLDCAGVRKLAGAKLPRRQKNSHKNDHGHLLIIGGDSGMGGAVILAAEAALRTGAGMVSVATRAEHIPALLARCPEVMVREVANKEQLLVLQKKASAIVIGPGLGQSDWATELLSAVLAVDLPMVIDADGLNLLAKKRTRKESWVLTPHPGEASRLLARDNIQADRFSAAQDLQQQYGGSVVLKGAGSLVTNGNETVLCPFGNPGMATAGMGDVLSGVIGALLAQGFEGNTAASLGVTIHSMAGDIATQGTGERGLIASDVISELRRLCN